MTAEMVETTPTRPHEDHGAPHHTRIVVAYGFWIFILSDIVMFSALFASYAVLSSATAGGPTGAELFNLQNVFVLTMCLLLSSYTCGLMMLSAEQGQLERFAAFAVLTFVLGAAFLALELSEFGEMIRKGAGPWRSAFLSAFFTLVGMHGAHVGAGLVWLSYMAAQVVAKGLSPRVLRRLLCFSLFWHALDIVWVGVMTLVYLMGVQR
jgi:cytochrome o ubiquinol oxidase subunit 3